jgi:hypothetical protein
VLLLTVSRYIVVAQVASLAALRSDPPRDAPVVGVNARVAWAGPINPKP